MEDDDVLEVTGTYVPVVTCTGTYEPEVAITAIVIGLDERTD